MPKCFKLFFPNVDNQSENCRRRWLCTVPGHFVIPLVVALFAFFGTKPLLGSTKDADSSYFTHGGAVVTHCTAEAYTLHKLVLEDQAATFNLKRITKKKTLCYSKVKMKQTHFSIQLLIERIIFEWIMVWLKRVVLKRIHTSKISVNRPPSMFRWNLFINLCFLYINFMLIYATVCDFYGKFYAIYAAAVRVCSWEQHLVRNRILINGSLCNQKWIPVGNSNS